jgi:hypothetical protein
VKRPLVTVITVPPEHSYGAHGQMIITVPTGGTLTEEEHRAFLEFQRALFRLRVAFGTH